MRWDALFADLEAEADRLAAQERAGEVEAVTRAEVARLRLVERLRPAVGTVIAIRVLGSARMAGVLGAIGPDWLMLELDNGREAIVALPAVLSIGGLSRLSDARADDPLFVRLGLRRALRAVARDRSAVRIQLVDGSVWDGTLDRVGEDFVELATHAGGELRRRQDVRDVQTVPLHALGVIHRQA